MAHIKNDDQRIAEIKKLLPFDKLNPARYDAGHADSPHWWGKQIFLRVQLKVVINSPASTLSEDARKSLVLQLLDSPFEVPAKPSNAALDSVWLADIAYANSLVKQQGRLSIVPVVPLRVGRVHKLMKEVPLTDKGELDPVTDARVELFSAIGPGDRLASPYLMRRAVEIDLEANNEAIVSSLMAWVNEERSELARLKSLPSIDLSTMTKWKQQRQLLYFDATLWHQLFKPGVRGAKTRALELARLSGTEPNLALGKDSNDVLQDALESAATKIFTLERAKALMAMPF